MTAHPANTPIRRLTAFLTRRHRSVFIVAVLAQSWMLALPFQFDDFGLLADPLAIFAIIPESAEAPGFMLRWTLWLFWALCRVFSGEILSPIPFHAAALLLHGFTSLLLARLVTRLAAADFAKRAGLFAGLAFALSTGGIQAVSWAAAQSDLLFPLFGLLAAGAFFDSRECAGKRRTRLHLRALTWTVLALWSKAPAFLVPVVLFLLLWACRPSRTERRSFLPRMLRVESLWLLLALAIGFGSRFLYLGSFQLRYQATSVDFSQLPTLIPRAVAALSQALYPWNRHEVFWGEGPQFAHNFSALTTASPTLIAALLFGIPIVLAIVLEKRVRAALAIGLVLTLLTSLPTALLYSDQPTNVIGRTTYFPLLCAWSTVALACSALLFRVRVVGLTAITIVALSLVDSGVHVIRTERLCADYQRTALDAVERTHAEYLAAGYTQPLTQIVILPDNGLGGIPALGFRLGEAFRPPFYPAPGLDVRVFKTPAEALESLATDSLADRTLRVLGREWVIEPETDLSRADRGRAWRELLSVRPWSPLRPGLAQPKIQWTATPGSLHQRWTAKPPVSAHALSALAFTVAPGPACEAELIVERPDTSHPVTPIPISLPASDSPRRVALQPWLELKAAYGPPVHALSWTAAAKCLELPQPLVRLPTLELLTPEADALVSLTNTPPVFRAAAPREWTHPAAARLTLRQLLPRGPRELFSDHPLALDPAADPATDPPADPATSPSAGRAPNTPLELPFLSAHIHAQHPPAAPTPPDAYPWPTIRAQLEVDIQNLSRYSGHFDWRITLHHPAGHPAARSPRRSAQFRPTPSFP